MSSRRTPVPFSSPQPKRLPQWWPCAGGCAPVPCSCSVEAGRLAVDDNEDRAVALGQLRKPGRRVDDERGARDDKQIGGERLDFGTAHRLDRHRLAKRDRRGLDPTTAVAAHRCGPVALEGAAQFGNLIPPRAIEAMRVGRVAVQFDDLLGGNAGGLMEPVDVLGDHRSGGAAAHELGNRTMTAVRLRVAPGVVGLETATPGFAPGLLGGEKIREVDRRHLGPNPARAAEIGNSRFGADAGASEDDGLAGPVDEAGELGDLIIDRHHRSLANPPRRAKLAVRSWRDERTHRLSRGRRVCRRARP